MTEDIETKFKYFPEIPVDQAELEAAGQRLRRNIETWTALNFPEIIKDINLFDRMGRAMLPAALDTWRKIGNMGNHLPDYIKQTTETAHNGGDHEETLKLIRISFLMGLMEKPRGSWRFWQKPNRTRSFHLTDAEQIFEENKTALEAKQAAAAAQAATATAPSPEPTGNLLYWETVDLTGKNEQWVTAWHEAENQWNAVSTNLPADDSPASEETRFRTGWALVHEYLERHSNVLSSRALIDFLLPQIWSKPDYMKNFFEDRENMEQPKSVFAINPPGEPYPQPTGLDDLPKVPEILFIPPGYQGRKSIPVDLNRHVYRRLIVVVHEDVIGRDKNISPNLKTYANLLNVLINLSWEKVKPLQ